MKVFLQTFSGREYVGLVKFVSVDWLDIVDIHGRNVSINFKEIKLIQEEK